MVSALSMRSLTYALLLALPVAFRAGFPAPAWPDELPFGAAQTIDANFDGAISLATGDIDGDGVDELVGAATVDGDIAFWRNAAGDGSTWTRTLVDGDFPGARSVHVANISRQTRNSDILAVSTDHIRVWRNTSNDGSGWTTSDVSTPATFPGPRFALPAEIDGTGGLDVVGVSVTGVAWWFNRFAIGQIWDKVDIEVTGGGASSAAVADIDGDGDTDVVVTFYDADEIVWYENTAGDGSAWTRRSVATGFDGAQSVTVADIDRDGDFDIAGAAQVDDTIAWWENTMGDGSAWMERVVDATVEDASSVEALDIDGDGDIDLLAAAAALGEMQWFDNTAGDGSAWTTRDLPGTFFGAAAAIALDVDDDGDQDVLGAALGADEVAWWENQSIHRSAAFPIEIPIAPSLGNVRSVHTADVDGDGDDDLLAAIQDTGDVLWWENTAGDGSAWTQHTIDAAYAGASGVYAGDLDSDGDLDVYATSLTQNNGVWWENLAGDGSSWGPPFQIFSGNFEPSNPQIVDIDGDGTLDVMAVMTASFRVTFWLNLDGMGTNWLQRIAQGNSPDMRSAHAIDMDGDGDADIATVASRLGTVSYIRNGGSLGFQVNVIDNAFTDAFSTFAADLDDDGDRDILAASRSTGEIAWWENTTSHGDFGPRQTLVTGFVGVTLVRAADLDGDGDVDIYGTSATSSTLVWWENTGDGSTWTQHQVDSSLALAGPAWTADLDRDGKLDLIAGGGGGELDWWPNLGGELALPTTDIATPFVADGLSISVLRIDAAHRGRTGDSPVELATVEILLESTAGTPMTDAEAEALLGALALYADDGSGSFEPGADTQIASLQSFALQAGVATLVVADDQAAAQLAVGSGRSYFVVPTFEATASSTSLDVFRFTHVTEASSTGEDAVNDLPLTLEYAANVATQPISFNDAPTALDDGVGVNEDQTVSSNVLDGSAGGLDSDTNGQSLTAVLVSPPAQGLLVSGLASDGSFQYQPNANFAGIDTFTYRADDGLAQSNVATVTVTVAPVNDPPTFEITAQHVSNEDAGSQTVAGFAFDIAAGPANESGQAVTFSITGNTNVSLFSTPPAIAADGTLTYTAAADAAGTATLSTRLSDNGGTGNGGSDQSIEQSFDIVIQPVNDAPSFTLPLAQHVSDEDGGAQSAPAFAIDIEAGPEDEASQTVSFSITANSAPVLFATPPALSSDGTLTYTAAPNANGTASIMIRLSDNGGTSNGGSDQSPEQSFDIVINAINDAPSFTISAQHASPEDAGGQSVPAFATEVLAGPADESGQTLTFSVTQNSNPSLFATLPAIAEHGTLTYTAAPDANGTATITVLLMDDGGTAGGGIDQSAAQSFDIEILAVNDPPSFVVPESLEAEASATPQSVLGFASKILAGPTDETSQALHFEIVSNTAPEIFAKGPEIEPNGTLTFTLMADVSGETATIEAILVDDGGTEFGGSDTSNPAEFDLIVPDAVAPSVLSTSTPDGPLAACTEARQSITRIEVQFSEVMAFANDPGNSASVLNPENYYVVGSGPDQDVTTSACGAVADDDQRILTSAVRPGATGADAATVELASALGDGLYKLLVCDTLEDTAGNALDTTLEVPFRVSTTNLFTNGQVDCDLGAWQIATGFATGGKEVTYSDQDADNASLSGSINVVSLQNTDFALGQCIDVSSTAYDLATRIRIEGLSGVEVQVGLGCERFSQPACTGSVLGDSTSQLLLSPTGGTWEHLEHRSEGGQSAICSVSLRLTAGDFFEAFVDGFSTSIQLFADGFESGDTSSWSVTVP